MEKKLSKHFIYKWLREDAYGEYLLHSSNKFSSLLLLNLWDFINIRRNVQRGALIPNTYFSRQVDFITASLRKVALIPQRPGLRNLHFRNWVKAFFINNILLHKRILNSPVFYPLYLGYLKNKPQFRKVTFWFSNNRVRGWRVFKSNISKRLRYILGKRRRLRRKRNYFKLNFRKKRLGRPYKAPYSKKFISPFRKRQLTLFRKKAKARFIHKIKRFSRPYRRVKNKKVYPALDVRCSAFKKRIKPPLKLFYNTLATSRILTTSWDTLAYKLKRRGRRHLNFKPTKWGSLGLGYARLNFRGVFNKRVKLVKKNEVFQLLKFRLFSYYNLINTSSDFYSQFKSHYYKAKTLALPSLSYLEFHLVSVLLRSGFLENGYVAMSLVKRGLFLVNGHLPKTNVALRLWDIITPSRPLWWLIYARFLNFFYNLLGTKKIVIKPSPKLIFRRLLRMRALFRKFNYKKSLRGRLSRLLSSKNFIFTLPPSYMEVSYKLFVIVLFSLATKFRDATRPTNLRGLKSILPSSNSRTFSVY